VDGASSSSSRGFQEAVSNFLMEQGAAGLEETEENRGVSLKAYFARDGKEKRRVDALHRYLKSLKRIFRENFHCRVQTSLLEKQDWVRTGKGFSHLFRSDRDLSSSLPGKTSG